MFTSFSLGPIRFHLNGTEQGETVCLQWMSIVHTLFSLV